LFSLINNKIYQAYLTYRSDIRVFYATKAEELWAKNETVLPGHDADLEVVKKGMAESIQISIKDSINFLSQIPGKFLLICFGILHFYYFLIELIFFVHRFWRTPY
jgi:hypothetical protein